MAKPLWQESATRLGERLAAEMQITALPVNPTRIAAAKGIVVEPLPPDRKTVSGILVKSGDNFGIQYATYLDNIGFEHFSIAHELGHYHLPGHPEALLGTGAHFSKAGFRSSDRHELEADHFAAGLLMPRPLFSKEINRHDGGLSAVEHLAVACETSLTATAIRYAQLTPDPIAAIVSEGDCIDYCFLSEELRNVPKISWPRKRVPLPNTSCTFRLNQSHDGVRHAERAEGETSFVEWFGVDLEADVYEECVGLGTYGKTLTIISIDGLPDDELLEDEDELQESWTPRFHR